MDRPNPLMNSAAPVIRMDSPRAKAAVGKASDGRHCWIARLMATDGPGILRLLYRFLSREADVLDAYQECFCKLAAMGDRPDLVSAKAYAYRTASNIAIEMIRTRGRRAAHHEEVGREKTAGQVAGDECQGAALCSVTDLRDAIAHLPTHLRNVVVLRDLSGMSYEDVGRTLRIDPATARVYRRHAVVKLAELMGTQGERT